MSKVNLKYECCEEPIVKFNISSIRSNSNFKHIVSNLDDLQIKSQGFGDRKKYQRPGMEKITHRFSRHVFCASLYLLNIDCIVCHEQVV
jgi:hypothetical protein